MELYPVAETTVEASYVTQYPPQPDIQFANSPVNQSNLIARTDG